MSAPRVMALVLGGIVVGLATSMLVLAGVVREVAPQSSVLFVGLAIYTLVIGLIFVPRIWRSR